MTRRSAKITDLPQLCDRLAQVFQKLEDGTLETKVAKELNNTAGKMMGTVGLRLKAIELGITKDQIAFLGDK
jgi:hypothetical protein